MYWWGEPYSIGYSIVSLLNDTVTANVSLSRFSDIELRTITVKALYVNGSPVEDAWVYSYIPYLWYRGGVDARFYGRTGSDGAVKLVVPELPVFVGVRKYVYTKLEPITITKTLVVGGENITLEYHCYPKWIVLAGSAIVYPNQTTVNITVRYVKEGIWWYYPLALDMEVRGVPEGGYGGYEAIAGAGYVPGYQAGIPGYNIPVAEAPIPGYGWGGIDIPVQTGIASTIIAPTITGTIVSATTTSLSTISTTQTTTTEPMKTESSTYKQEPDTMEEQGIRQLDALLIGIGLAIIVALLTTILLKGRR